MPKLLPIVIATLAIAAPLRAELPDQVSAADPAGLVAVLDFAGYGSELGTDGVGDPQIQLEYAGWPGYIQFYGCDSESHEECDALQFRVGFDRRDPLPPELALDLMASYRFASVSRDAEGDPWVTWDIVTHSGIDSSVFLASLRAFERNIALIADIVFAEETGEETAGEAEPAAFRS